MTKALAESTTYINIFFRIEQLSRLKKYWLKLSFTSMSKQRGLLKVLWSVMLLYHNLYELTTIAYENPQSLVLYI